LAIFGGFLTVFAMILMPETNPHILLQRRAKTKRKETGDDRWHAKAASEPPARLIMLSLYRPMKVYCLLWTQLTLASHFQPNCVVSRNVSHCPTSDLTHSALGIIFGYVYLLFTTFPEVFGETYHWNEGIIGLSYLGAGIGFFIGLILVGTTSDRLVNRLTAKHGVRKPEYRMRVMMFYSPLIAIGMFWYGWSADKKAPWYFALRMI
jgi:hypothetical protein